MSQLYLWRMPFQIFWLWQCNIYEVFLVICNCKGLKHGIFKKSSFILYAVFSNYKWWVSIKSQKVLVTNKNKTRVDAPEKGDCRLVIESWPLYVTIVYTDHHDFEENNVNIIVLLIRDLYCNINNIKMRCNLRNERLPSVISRVAASQDFLQCMIMYI